MSALRRSLPLLALAFVVTSFVYMPVCNATFACGCTWPGLGSADHCNMHDPQPPHCPICDGGYATQAGFFVAIALPVTGLLGGTKRLVTRRA